MRWIVPPLVLFVRCSIFAAAECPAPGSIVELSGTIGTGLRISMNLTFQKDGLSGWYAYVKYGKNIRLSGTCTGGSLTLQESDASGKPTGSFRGSFTSPQIAEGTWSTPDGKRSLPFRLQAAVPADRVSGEYKTGLDEKSDSGAVLNILLLDHGRLRIQGDASWVGNAQTGFVRSGFANGTAKLEGDKAYFVGPYDSGDICRFTIRFTVRAIIVTDDNGTCGGMNVTFNGTYARIGPPQIEEPFVR